MARIIIQDLPEDMAVSREEMRSITGGAVVMASTLGVAASSSGGMTLCFPDVCKTPSPGGPIPIPYPNIGMSSGTSSGSKTVKVDGSPISLGGGTYSTSSGDEAGTA